MNQATKRKLRFLGGFALYFGVLWMLWDTPLVYPLKIFVVLLHEASHALAAVATGGTIQRIVLDPYQGGACYCPGGSAFLTLSAGYLGSLAWGSAMILGAQAKKVRTDWVNGLVGGLVIALTALYVRSWFGVVFGIAFGLAMVGAARKLNAAWNRALLLTLGLTSSLYAILDIKSDVLDRPHLESDAAMLAGITPISTFWWGVIWIAVAVGVSWLVFRRAYRSA